MYNELQKMIYTIDEAEFEKAIRKLKKYNQGIALLNQNFQNNSYQQTYTKPLDKLRIQNSVFRECKFQADFQRSNLSGSQFYDCEMAGIKIDNSNFQFSNMRNCLFNDCVIEGNNFANCYLDKVLFDGNTFIGNNYSRSYFDKCTIRGGDVFSSTLEFSVFNNTTFENLRLANLSMEYSEFINVHMNNVILPFAQLPFIFNGLDYILHTEDTIAVSANMQDCQSISVDEYLETLHSWKVFFCKKLLYFPLSNILLAEGKKEEALESILSGIVLTINRSDYRTLKYLCKLAASHQNVSRSDCLKLYERIKELLSLNFINDEQQYNLALHLADIKNILVENPKCNPQLYISIQTNIHPENRKLLLYIVDFLETLISKEHFNIDSKTVSLRHNSPYEILVIVVGTVVILKKLKELIQNTVSGSKVIIEDILSIYIACEYKVENEKLDLESKKAFVEKEKLEVEKQKLEVEKLRLEIQQFQREMENNHVKMSVTHNIQETNKIYIA